MARLDVIASKRCYLSSKRILFGYLSGQHSSRSNFKHTLKPYRRYNEKRLVSKYSVNLRIQSEYGKIRARKNSVFGHFLRSGYCVVECPLGSVSVIIELPKKITAVTLKVSFKTWGGITERCEW